MTVTADAVELGGKTGRDVAAALADGRLTQAEADQLVADIKEGIRLEPLVVKEVKAGRKTSEFWLTVSISVLTLLGAFPLPPKFEVPVASALAAAYAISRGIAKKS